MTFYRRSPRPLGVPLGLLQGGWVPATILGEVQSVWGTVVGEVVAREAMPVAERAGVLTVSCSASVWAAELDLMAPMILEKLNGAIRGGRVTKLRCSAST